MDYKFERVYCSNCGKNFGSNVIKRHQNKCKKNKTVDKVKNIICGHPQSSKLNEDPTREKLCLNDLNIYINCVFN